VGSGVCGPRSDGAPRRPSTLGFRAGPGDSGNDQHIAFHDPEGVLTSVAVDRELIEEHAPRVGWKGNLICSRCIEQDIRMYRTHGRTPRGRAGRCGCGRRLTGIGRDSSQPSGRPDPGHITGRIPSSSSGAPGPRLQPRGWNFCDEPTVSSLWWLLAGWGPVAGQNSPRPCQALLRISTLRSDPASRSGRRSLGPRIGLQRTYSADRATSNTASAKSVSLVATTGRFVFRRVLDHQTSQPDEAG
jgi:hypothetical protein